MEHRYNTHDALLIVSAAASLIGTKEAVIAAINNIMNEVDENTKGVLLLPLLKSKDPLKMIFVCLEHLEFDNFSLDDNEEGGQ